MKALRTALPKVVGLPPTITMSLLLTGMFMRFGLTDANRPVAATVGLNVV